MIYTNNVEGWISPVELDWLHQTARKFSVVLEVGAYKAKSATALCDAIPDGRVYSVDNFKNREADIFRANLGVRSNHTLIRKPSIEAAKDFADGSIEMVFIDGDHSYESCRDDIKAWLPKASKLICGHDYTDDGVGHWPGVIRAVTEQFGNVVLVDKIWIVNID